MPIVFGFPAFTPTILASSQLFISTLQYKLEHALGRCKCGFGGAGDDWRWVGEIGDPGFHCSGLSAASYVDMDGQ